MDDYGLNSNASFYEKVEKGVPYHHSKAVGPKPTWWQFGTFRVKFSTPKVPNWLLEAERTFVFGCHLVFPFRVFWPVLVPRRVFNLRLWFFISFLDNSSFFKNNYLVDKSLKINLDNIQIIPNFVVIQSSILFLCMHPYFKH